MCVIDENLSELIISNRVGETSMFLQAPTPSSSSVPVLTSAGCVCMKNTCGRTGVCPRGRNSLRGDLYSNLGLLSVLAEPPIFSFHCENRHHFGVWNMLVVIVSWMCASLAFLNISFCVVVLFLTQTCVQCAVICWSSAHRVICE